MAVNDFTYQYALTKNSGGGTYTISGGAVVGPYDFVDPGGGADAGTLVGGVDLANSLQITTTGGGESSFTINGVSGYTYIGDTTDGVLVSLSLGGGNKQFFLFSNSAFLSTGALEKPISESHAICFLAGTRIATARGDRYIETLRIGDEITLADGSRKEVKWVGRMTLPLTRFNRHTATPILIRAGALGDGLPRRDLYTSYHHGFALDGVLVIAGLLVNGTSIVQCADWPESAVTYFQVEVEGHHLMIAEGAAVETFGEDGDNRSKFDNAAEFHMLYPNAVAAEPMPLGRVVAKRQLPKAVKARIETAAAELGYSLLAEAA